MEKVGLLCDMHGFIFLKKIKRSFSGAWNIKIRREEESSIGTTPIAIKTQAGEIYSDSKIFFEGETVFRGGKKRGKK